MERVSLNKSLMALQPPSSRSVDLQIARYNAMTFKEDLP